MSYYSAPTYNIDTNTWETTEFESRKDVVTYINAQVKYPGEYKLKYTEGYWNAQAKIFQRTGSYPVHMPRSLDFKKHWDAEKAKCAFEGFVIYRKKSEKVEFAVPGLMYWYLNYCPIVDKLKRKIDLPEIYDGDYHYFLYILRCILRRKYGVVLKKRQAGYTLKNMAIFLNAMWFGAGAVSKIFAAEEASVKDSWSLMEHYRDHINNHCGWKRGFDPMKKLDWQIRRKKKDGSGYIGNMSIGKGFTTKQDPTAGVGGNATVIFGEEFGKNPTGDITHEYITSNVALGGITTGLIIYSGAVGELDKADSLKEFMLRPEDNDFLYCPNNIEDDAEFGDKVGFFAPEWWNYVSGGDEEDEDDSGEVVRFYDEWGNTKRELALKEIERRRKRAQLKKPESYRYYCSQRPLSIREAFAIRKDTKFPAQLLEAQKRRIENKEYPMECVELERNDLGKVVFKQSSKLPIKEFPLSKKTENKEGCVVLYERPPANPEFGCFYASVDPVRVGKTKTSESLVSIQVYKNDVEITRIHNGEVKTFVEGGKLVAQWCGRFDDPNKNHERLELLIELYNAWTVVENNVTEFIQYMIHRNKQKYLVPHDQMISNKDMSSTANTFQKYGWTNTGTIFKEHYLNYAISFVKEELHQTALEDGTVVKTTFGIERIPDIMLLKEMEAYQDGMNVDRLVSWCALVAFVKVQQSNRGYKKRVEDFDKDKQKGKPKVNPYDVKRSAFKNLGMQKSDSPYKVDRRPFKNFGE